MLQHKQDKLLFYGMQYICEYCGNQFMSPVTMVIQNIFVKTEKICYGRIIVLQTSYIELQSIIDISIFIFVGKGQTFKCNKNIILMIRNPISFRSSNGANVVKIVH